MTKVGGNSVQPVSPVYRVILTEKDREQARRDREERYKALHPESDSKKLVKKPPGTPTGKSWQV